MSNRQRATLHEACYEGRLEVVQELLDAGVDPNTPAPEGHGWISCAGVQPRPLNLVAIAHALTEKHVAIARLLISRGAFVDDSILQDLGVEMVGSTHDIALYRILTEAAERKDA